MAFISYSSAITKANLTMPQKSSGSTKGHYFDILGSTQVPEATYKV